MKYLFSIILGVFISQNLELLRCIRKYIAIMTFNLKMVKLVFDRVEENSKEGKKNVSRNSKSVRQNTKQRTGKYRRC